MFVDEYASNEGLQFIVLKEKESEQEICRREIDEKNAKQEIYIEYEVDHEEEQNVYLLNGIVMH